MRRFVQPIVIIIIIFTFIGCWSQSSWRRLANCSHLFLALGFSVISTVCKLKSELDHVGLLNRLRIYMLATNIHAGWLAVRLFWCFMFPEPLNSKLSQPSWHRLVSMCRVYCCWVAWHNPSCLLFIIIAFLIWTVFILSFRCSVDVLKLPATKAMEATSGQLQAVDLAVKGHSFLLTGNPGK